MKKRKFKSKKNVTKTEIEVLEDVKLLKVQLVEDIEDVIGQYYSEILETCPCGLSKLGAIDIISALELAKLRFYCSHKNYIHQKRIFQNQVGR